MNCGAYAALVNGKDKQVSGARVLCQVRLWPSQIGLRWQIDRTVKLAAQEDAPSCKVRCFAAPNGQDWLAESLVGDVLAGQVVEVKPT
jgi:hypothetical protein